MSQKINAIVFESVNKTAVKEVTLAECEPDQIVCETIFTFVSPGTELRVLGAHYSSEKRFSFNPRLFSCLPGLSKPVLKSKASESEIWSADVIRPKRFRAINPCGAVRPACIFMRQPAKTGPFCCPPPPPPPRDADPFDYVIAEVAAISFRGVEAADPVQGETAVVIGQGLIGAILRRLADRPGLPGNRL